MSNCIMLLLYLSKSIRNLENMRLLISKQPASSNSYKYLFINCEKYSNSVSVLTLNKKIAFKILQIETRPNSCPLTCRQWSLIFGNPWHTTLYVKTACYDFTLIPLFPYFAYFPEKVPYQVPYLMQIEIWLIHPPCPSFSPSKTSKWTTLLCPSPCFILWMKR